MIVAQLIQYERISYPGFRLSVCRKPSHNPFPLTLTGQGHFFSVTQYRKYWRIRRSARCSVREMVDL